MSATVSCTELKQRMENGAVVVDVMTPEEYAASHLSGAVNACIYEMVFLERIAESVPDRGTEVVVYDATGRSRTAELARERLLQAGYQRVSVLEGGLAAWCSEGRQVENGEQLSIEVPLLQDGNYRIDPEMSRLEWIGRNLNNRHFGHIALQGGYLVIRKGMPSEGRIIADMTAMTNLDLQDPAWNALLVRHLKSDDFFAVERFPTAVFRLTGWKSWDGGAPEAPNGHAAGELTIRDVTRPVSFPAIVAPQADGSIKAHAVLDIDRTLWDVCYGSGKLFERLGMHLVHDIITLELFIRAARG